MNFADFDKFQKELFDEIASVRDAKGKEYANSSDRFANFTRLAQRLGISRNQVALVYLAKHMDSIDSYVRNGKSFSNETIRSRFVDAINYLTLLAGMIAEDAGA